MTTKIIQFINDTCCPRFGGNYKSTDSNVIFYLKYKILLSIILNMSRVNYIYINKLYNMNALFEAKANEKKSSKQILIKTIK